jgi:ParB family chromosome partitioning protein
MPKRGANISLSSYDDIFETDESRADAQLERVQKIPIGELVPFKDHPFKVVDDEAMLRTTESIAQYGVLTPLIARPLEDGTYEIIPVTAEFMPRRQQVSQKFPSLSGIWMMTPRPC